MASRSKHIHWIHMPIAMCSSKTLTNRNIIIAYYTTDCRARSLSSLLRYLIRSCYCSWARNAIFLLFWNHPRQLGQCNACYLIYVSFACSRNNSYCLKCNFALCHCIWVPSPNILYCLSINPAEPYSSYTPSPPPENTCASPRSILDA